MQILTLPVMLAVAIAATISRALSYGTIYTTRLLRRGTDIDRTTPWRALQDLKIADTTQAQLAADWDHTDQAAALRQPPTPLLGYRVIEVTVGDGSPTAGARLGTITWPPGSIPVSILRGHSHRDPDPALILRPADQISLLTPAPAGDQAEVPGQAGNAPSP